MSKYGEKYPWLKIDSIFNFSEEGYDVMDDIPNGWYIAFGDMLCEELDNAIKAAGIENTVNVLRFENVNGSLRISLSEVTPEIIDILDKYRLISRHVCVKCGKPDVYLIKYGNHISPMCEDCCGYQKILYSPYTDNNEICDYVTVVHKVGDKDNKYERRNLYLKDTADKIRARYAKQDDWRD